MREIKFRVWDNVDYMSQPFTLANIQDKKIQFTKDCIVMQFTGMIFNEKEVYEGDIIKHIQGEQDKPAEEFEVIGVVKYHRGAFYIDSKNARRTTLYLSDIDGRSEITHRWEATRHRTYVYELAKDFEVIGNIYENPELINP